MSNTPSLFSFAGLLPDIPSGIWFHIEHNGNTGSHVAEDGVSVMTHSDKTEPPILLYIQQALVTFFSWTTGRHGEGALFSSLARQSRQQGVIS